MNLFSKGQGAFTKILSVTVGLTLGLVLLARVQLEKNYDGCVDRMEDVYEIVEYFQQTGQEMAEHNSTSGGTVNMFRKYIPEIEVGTRYTGWLDEAKIVMEDGQRYDAHTVRFADSCLFRIFDTPVVGDVSKALSVKGQCMISRSLADKIGGDVIGKSFYIFPSSGNHLTIGGVFDDYDDNTSFADCDILLSLPSIGMYMYDGTNDTFGNDRYNSFIRLRADADMSKVEEECNEMLRKELPMDDLKAAGYVDVGYRLVNPLKTRLNDARVKAPCTILTVVAIVMLFTAIMNYILVVIGTLAGKAKQVAVMKTMGASGLEFYKYPMLEATGHLFISLFLMAVMLIAGQDFCKELLGVPVSLLFSGQTFMIIIFVCVIVVVACGLIPGFIYSRIPLVYAFRHFSESKRLWKLSLLAFQFVLSSMMIVILVTVFRQYDYMLNKDLGYKYDNVVYTKLNISDEQSKVLIDEVKKLPCVESANTAYNLFCYPQSGDNVRLPNDNKDLFNVSNMFFASSDLVKTMGLELLRGRNFSGTDELHECEILVDETFERMFKVQTGEDDVIGKQVTNSSFGKETLFTIVGVVKDFVVRDLMKQDTRPVFIAHGYRYSNYALIKLNAVTPENLSAVQDKINKLYPDSEMQVNMYSSEIREGYVVTLRMRNLITIGCVSILLITLLGLIGYIRDEVQRRSRELAIRKILGADVMELQSLFMCNIGVIALPSFIVGAMLGVYFSILLMEQFPDKVNIPLWVYIVPLIILSVTMLVVVMFRTYRMSVENPVKNLRTE